MSTTRKMVPFEEWPANDRAIWEQAFATVDIFDDTIPSSVWAPRSRFSMGGSYSRWLGFLEMQGMLATDELPADRVTPENVSDYIEHLGALVKSSTAYTYLRYLCGAMQAMSPNRDWGWLDETVVNLRKNIPSMRGKRCRISADRLYAFGFDLMAWAERTPTLRSIDRAV